MDLPPGTSGPPEDRGTEEKKPGVEEPDELLQAARRRGLGLLDRQKQAAVDELNSVAGVMREAARRFKERQEEGVGVTVERAAERLERLSAMLRERNLGEIFREAENALRRHPAIVLGAAGVAAFAFGRLLRAGGRRIAGRREEGR